LSQDKSNIYGQRYSSARERIGPEFRVNAATGGYQVSPSVAALGNGFVVTWASEANTSGVFGQRFSP
jgi:large repetitive protein